MMSRNLILLLVAQFFSVSSTVLVVTTGGIIGAKLTTNPTWATLPMSMMVVGTALATLFAAWLMARIGRRWGFVAGAAIAAFGGALAAYALWQLSFFWFCAGIALLGVNGAFTQQYRFAAAESVAVAKAPTAISMVLLGSIGGAFVGPWLAAAGENWNGTIPFLGSIAFLIVLQLLNLLTLVGLNESVFTREQPADVAKEARPLITIVAQPAFIVAVLAAIVGGSTMTLIMTATPLSMHVDHNYSMSDTAWVIRSHVIAMYAPSLVSGLLITALGTARMMLIGVACVVVTVAVGLQGHEVMHYWWALVLLGVGWNFLFVGGTSALLGTYRPNERYKAQAFNEFAVFGASALASLMAGVLLESLGWSAILYLASAPLLVMLLLLLWQWSRGRVTVAT